jgi:hypothetical protein
MVRDETNPVNRLNREVSLVQVIRFVGACTPWDTQELQVFCDEELSSSSSLIDSPSCLNSIKRPDR